MVSRCGRTVTTLIVEYTKTVQMDRFFWFRVFRTVGRVVEGSGLLIRRDASPIVGSSPTLSASLYGSYHPLSLTRGYDQNRTGTHSTRLNLYRVRQASVV